MSEPIILDAIQIHVGKLAHHIDRARTLNRQLRIRVAQFLDNTVEALGVLANPVDVLLSRPGVDHQQKIVLAQSVHDHIIDKSALRVEQSRVVGLPDGQPRGIIHADVLHRR